MGEFKVTEYIVVGVVIWVAILSFFLFRAVSHYRKLARGQNIQDLGKILEGIVSNQDLHTRHIEKLASQLSKQNEIGQKHFTKHSLLRFNPFEESGGDQSFVVALLDNKNNGIVISSLHSRSGTRVYAKDVLSGNSVSHKFSKEEKEAVNKAVQHTQTKKSVH